ncbi:MAG: hypothetical protein IT462_01845 [Planctomycetes bacterium]|nr:hypothetical protein [Planctomycetota bacterium]
MSDPMKTLRWLLGAASLTALMLYAASCSQVPNEAVEGKSNPTAAETKTYEQWAREARGAFLVQRRNIETVKISVDKYREAIAIKADEYDVLWEAARSCVWMGNFGPDKERKEYVVQGIKFANAAVKVRPDGEEGLFYDAVLAGKLAELDLGYAPDGMKVLESRLKQLIDMHSTVIYGAPDRVYGILLMRAPGAPLSVGDWDKAYVHLKKGYEVDPKYPENPLYLSEIEFKLGKRDNKPEMKAAARRRLESFFFGPDSKPYIGSEFEWDDWKAQARKLLDDNPL